MGGASPVAALQNAALAVATGSRRTCSWSSGWNGYSAFRPREGDPAPRRGLDAGAVGDVVARLLPARTARAPPRSSTGGSRRATSCCTARVDTDTGEVAVAFREHAQLNDKALMRGTPLTMDDYLAARWVVGAVPALRLLPRDRLRRRGRRDDGRARARPAAAARRSCSARAEGHPYPADDIANRPDLFRIGLTDAAPRAFAMAGVRPHDVDFLEIYDCFTYVVLLQLEALGLCGRGEAGAFVRDGAHRSSAAAPDEHPRRAALAGAHVGHEPRRRGGAPAPRRRRGRGAGADAELGCVTGWGDFGDGSIVVLGADR